MHNLLQTNLLHFVEKISEKKRNIRCGNERKAKFYATFVTPLSRRYTVEPIACAKGK
jgi:hypothetical protein